MTTRESKWRFLSPGESQRFNVLTLQGHRNLPRNFHYRTHKRGARRLSKFWIEQNVCAKTDSSKRQFPFVTPFDYSHRVRDPVRYSARNQSSGKLCKSRYFVMSEVVSFRRLRMISNLRQVAIQSERSPGSRHSAKIAGIAANIAACTSSRKDPYPQRGSRT